MYIAQLRYNSITEEQKRIVNYNSVLEDRRLRVMEFIKTSEELEISKRACENLMVNSYLKTTRTIPEYDKMSCIVICFDCVLCIPDLMLFHITQY